MGNKTVAEVIEGIKTSGYCPNVCIARAFGKLKEVSDYCNSIKDCEACDKEWISILADMIDHEKAEAVSAAMEQTMAEHMREWANDNGLPSFHDGESFKAWLDRCFLKLPRYTDGEPEYFGDGTDKLHGVEKFIYLRSGECCQMQDADGNMQTVFPGERVQRPALKALDADGMPIEEDEIVWLKDSGEEAHVIDVKPTGRIDVVYTADEERAHDLQPCIFTHTPPDTQERIDGDVNKSPFSYFGRSSSDVCQGCPAWKHDSCSKAKMLDLLRRQRELDERKGGAE